MNEPDLLTGRQLVHELQRRGVGVWTAESVRQWIRETPPCPIAAAADQGKPHRYELRAVMLWLLERAKREHRRGFTSAAAQTLVERLERALSGAAPEPEELELPAAQNAPTSGLSPAKQEGDWSVDEIERSTDLDLVLHAYRGRNPQGWKMVEDALAARLRRLTAERRVVPIEDLERALTAFAIATRAAAQALVIQLAQRLDRCTTFDERRRVIQTAVDGMLDALAAEESTLLVTAPEASP